MRNKPTIQIIFFSPTGNTRKICATIANGTQLPLASPPFLNISSINLRDKNKINIAGDIIILGSPVYVETMPKTVFEVIQKLEGQGKWIIPVAVNGNVSFGRCLEELIGLLRNRGFKILAGAKFVGRNSLSNESLLLGENRPDATDIKRATKFGQNLWKKWQEGPEEITIKGSIPEFIQGHPEIRARRMVKIPQIDLILCTKCRECWAACPVEAIDFDCFTQMDFDLVIDKEKCIRCFACVQSCPFGALTKELTMPPEMKADFDQYTEIYQKPEIFL
ncbi:4Fe-4S binding protein [Candidatus Lokiarchaeum ossiferum]|uniref:4Fe-4S binding protein n=1 Tax=Candidatus Lokiarchaeum ossiferum TaxID=2951803 RepID=UPI00352C3022